MSTPSTTPNATRRSGRTGRPPLTNQAAVLTAARELGFADLTLGAVAAKVGVKYSTSYRHYSSLTALVTDLVDVVLDEASWPESTRTWRDHITAVADTLTRTVVANPGMAAAIASLPVLPHRLQQARTDAEQALLDTGLEPDDAGVTARAVLRAVLAISLPPRPPDAGSSDADVEVELDPDGTAQRAEVSAVVQLVLDGVETRLAAAAAAADDRAKHLRDDRCDDPWHRRGGHVAPERADR